MRNASLSANCSRSAGSARNWRFPFFPVCRLNDLAVAVANKEAGRLTKIPGVGKKTADRLLLELQGKFAVSGAGMVPSAATSGGNDIVNALQALGYNNKEADWAAKQLPKDIGVSDGIRQALKLLSKA